MVVINNDKMQLKFKDYFERGVSVFVDSFILFRKTYVYLRVVSYVRDATL